MEYLTQTTTQTLPQFVILSFLTVDGAHPSEKLPIHLIIGAAKEAISKNPPKRFAVIAAMSMTLLSMGFNAAGQIIDDTVALRTRTPELQLTNDNKSHTEKASAAIIKNGHAANAEGASNRRDVVAIWLYTEGVDDKGFDAQGYARELKKLFDNSGIHPGAPVEFYCEQGIDGVSTRAVVYINGDVYNLETDELQPAGGVYHPYSVGHRVQQIIRKWAKENGVVLSATTPRREMTHNNP